MQKTTTYIDGYAFLPIDNLVNAEAAVDIGFRLKLLHDLNVDWFPPGVAPLNIMGYNNNLRFICVKFSGQIYATDLAIVHGYFKSLKYSISELCQVEGSIFYKDNDKTSDAIADLEIKLVDLGCYGYYSGEIPEDIDLDAAPEDNDKAVFAFTNWVKVKNVKKIKHCLENFKKRYKVNYNFEVLD